MQFGHEKGDGLYTLELSLGFEKVSLRSLRTNRPQPSFSMAIRKRSWLDIALQLAAPTLLIQIPALLPFSGLLELCILQKWWQFVECPLTTAKCFGPLLTRAADTSTTKTQNPKPQSMLVLCPAAVLPQAARAARRDGRQRRRTGPGLCRDAPHRPGVHCACALLLPLEVSSAVFYPDVCHQPPCSQVSTALGCCAK